MIYIRPIQLVHVCTDNDAYTKMKKSARTIKKPEQ